MIVQRLQKFVLIGFIVAGSAFCYSAETVKSGDLTWLEQYNVVWTSQSKNSGESIPCSGGDIGLNVWVENDELLIYMAPTLLGSQARGLMCLPAMTRMSQQLRLQFIDQRTLGKDVRIRARPLPR